MEIPDWYANRRPCPTCSEEHPRCGGHSSDGDGQRPCRRQPAAGQWRCATHASQAEKEAAVDVAAMIAQYEPIGDLMRRAAVTTRNRTYIESLEDALHRVNTMVVVLAMLVETLPAHAEASTFTVAEDTPREQVVWQTDTEGLVGPGPDGELGVHPYLALYEKWTLMQGQLSKIAADLGLTERQVEVQEVQVRLMATTLSGILSDLGIDLADPRTRSVVERHLLQMETASVDTSGALTATATAS